LGRVRAFDVLLGASIFLTGPAAGIIAQLLLSHALWVPKLTWVPLSLFGFVLLPVGGLVSGMVIAQVAFPAPAATYILPFAGTFLGFGLWALVARAMVFMLLRSPGKGGARRETRRAIAILAGQIILVLFVALSWLPGIGTLFLGGMIGLSGLLVLAAWGTVSLAPGERTPLRLATTWFFPVLTTAALAAVFIMEAVASTRY